MNYRANSMFIVCNHYLHRYATVVESIGVERLIDYCGDRNTSFSHTILYDYPMDSLLRG